MSRGPFAAALGARRNRPQEPEDPRAVQLARENKKIKDDIAQLCQRWRKDGSLSHAVELERVMGWTPAGDPMTGCLPVTPPRE